MKYTLCLVVCLTACGDVENATQAQDSLSVAQICTACDNALPGALATCDTELDRCVARALGDGILLRDCQTTWGDCQANYFDAASRCKANCNQPAANRYMCEGTCAVRLGACHVRAYNAEDDCRAQYTKYDEITCRALWTQDWNMCESMSTCATHCN